MSEPRTHLIWSKSHAAWHKRDKSDGEARGYTTKILEAGIFETSTAMGYAVNASVNKAVPILEARRLVDAEVIQKRGEWRAAEAKQAEFNRLCEAAGATA
ncbi:MAG TPA: hypothetical protein VFJ46_17700 [Xanthobacteraceae bacterium]|nr:hypothetical protein [Xanthobacteraceae bacterium]